MTTNFEKSHDFYRKILNEVPQGPGTVVICPSCDECTFELGTLDEDGSLIWSCVQCDYALDVDEFKQFLDEYEPE